ncbi:SDR family NAD(P)-dependent oxidoreductase [Jiulongibacter sediminis]|jgi:3-oxoacyl-[acyl-carrier protein] reductase|uniref:SDR family NAD(P)-dependent oxidoreductase n=1 Tax=Jiulongibacter sediminis TaxID=1605367 RepID=UPI0026F07E40|nr:glucose 1-dehydrogenase [Jiulongibacter sediminis]
MKLKGRVAIVTGGGRDIGKMISLKLAAEGAKVVVNYFSGKEAAEQTLAEIEEKGGEAILVQGDMTQAADIKNLMEQTQKAFGDEVHVLVNNAGGLVARKTLAEMDEDFVNFVMALNFNSAVFVTQAVVPLMKSGASVINLSSLAARDGGGGGSAIYAASKGAITTFTRALSKEIGPKGIRANAVCPGMIATTFHDTFTTDEVRTKVAASTPLKREGAAAEVADLVAYLASDESTFINGNNIDINGGLAFS